MADIEAVAVKDQLWKVKIVKFSEVDSSGTMELIFDIIDDNADKAVLHPAMTVNGAPEDIINRARTVAAELRLKKEQAETLFNVGDEFEV